MLYTVLLTEKYGPVGLMVFSCDKDRAPVLKKVMLEGLQLAIWEQTKMLAPDTRVSLLEKDRVIALAEVECEDGYEHGLVPAFDYEIGMTGSDVGRTLKRYLDSVSDDVGRTLRRCLADACKAVIPGK